MVEFLLQPGSWQIRCWNADECSIEKCSDGKYIILDHSIQTVVAKADTLGEARNWLYGKDLDQMVDEELDRVIEEEFVLSPLD